MTVYLGDHGFVELKRISGEAIVASIGVADVNVDRRRFSFAQDVQGQLIKGDQVDIVRTDRSNLDFIVGHNERDWRGYVSVDIMGGIRLYDRFDKAVRGDLNEALQLRVPAANNPVLIKTRGSQYLQLAQVREFDFTTERETIDVTLLSDQFRKRHEAGLISGQGRLNCFWDHKNEICDPNMCGGNVELPVYLAQLCIRLVQGADFAGRFFIFTPGGNDPRADKTAVWYQCECIVTNASVTVNPTETIESNIEFITTGEIKLLIGVPPSYLLTEEPALLLQEDGSGLLLAGSD